MSLESAQSFRQRVQDDAELQHAVAAHVVDGVIDFAGLTALGAASGYHFSIADAEAVLAEQGDGLSDFELELVSGGTSSVCRGPSEAGFKRH